MRFRLVPKSSTLDDPERPICTLGLLQKRCVFWSTPQNFNEGSLGRVDPYTIGGIKMRHSINVWPFVILYYAYYESSYIRLSNDTRSLTLKDVG